MLVINIFPTQSTQHVVFVESCVNVEPEVLVWQPGMKKKCDKFSMIALTAPLHRWHKSRHSCSANLADQSSAACLKKRNLYLTRSASSFSLSHGVKWRHDSKIESGSQIITLARYQVLHFKNFSPFSFKSVHQN